MNSVTQEFWYGNITPQTDCRPKTLEIKELTEYITLHHNKLIMTMTKEQREIFEKLDVYWNEYVNCTEEAIFSYAFKLGIKMASEAFGEKFEHK